MCNPSTRVIPFSQERNKLLKDHEYMHVCRKIMQEFLSTIRREHQKAITVLNIHHVHAWCPFALALADQKKVVIVFLMCCALCEFVHIKWVDFFSEFTLIPARAPYSFSSRPRKVVVPFSQKRNKLLKDHEYMHVCRKIMQ